MNDFDRPVGPKADIKELEFISALHQSDLKNLRTNGSVTASDIVNFLSSRHGIIVTEEEVRAQILAGLGGGDGEEECLDITEVVAILLIPFLLKAAAETNSQFSVEVPQNNLFKSDEVVMPDTSNIIGDVAKMILSDSNDSTSDSTTTDCMSVSHTIDKDLVTRILTFYGEKDLARDEKLVEDMVLVMNGGDETAVLDEVSFARALTYDIQKYEVKNEKKATTNYFDVFGTHYTTANEGLSQTSPQHSSARAPIRFFPSLSPTNTGSSTFGAGGTVNDREVPSSSSEVKNGVVDVEVPSTQNYNEENVRPVKKIYTAPQIDSTADIYKSKFFTVILWAFFIMTNYAYLPNPTNIYDWLNCEQTKPVLNEFLEPLLDSIGVVATRTTSSFGCKVGNRIVHWFIIAFSLCLGGTFFISIGSIGNSIYEHSKKAVYLSCATMAAITVFPFVLTIDLSDNSEDINEYSNYYDYHQERRVANYIRWPAFILGILVVIMQISQLRGFSILQKFQEFLKKYDYGNINSESNLKQAAAHKTNLLVKNARELHGSIVDEESGKKEPKRRKFYDQAIFSFEKKGEFRRESCGGFRWAVRNVRSGELLRKEGVWISSRIIVGSLAQLIVSLLILALGLSTTSYLVDYIDDKRNGFGSLSLNNITSILDAIPLNANVTVDLEEPLIETAADDLQQDESVNAMQYAGFVGSVLAFLASIFLSLVSIPSAAATTLQFRCGLIPSLHDEQFHRYRVAPDSVSILLGSMFWGVFYAGAGVFSFFALFTFLILFPATQQWFTGILASFIGFAITWVLKWVLLKLSRRAFYAASYRIDPIKANFTILALECWNIGLGAGFMLARIIKLVLAVILYTGRADFPVVAPGVGQLGPIEFDDYTSLFRRDIVAHEAHRHPFLETLGVMYMMKLRYGASFASRAGSCWRLVFVFALMPWLRTYRILTKFDLLKEEEGSDVSEQKTNTREISRPFFSSIDLGKVQCPVHTHARLLIENVRLKQNMKLLLENARLKKKVEFLYKNKNEQREAPGPKHEGHKQEEQPHEEQQPEEQQREDNLQEDQQQEAQQHTQEQQDGKLNKAVIY